MFSVKRNSTGVKNKFNRYDFLSNYPKKKLVYSVSSDGGEMKVKCEVG